MISQTIGLVSQERLSPGVGTSIFIREVSMQPAGTRPVPFHVRYETSLALVLFLWLFHREVIEPKCLLTIVFCY